MKNIKKILLIRDNLDLYNLVISLLKNDTQNDYKVTTATSLDNGIKSLNEDFFDIVLLIIDHPTESIVNEVLSQLNTQFSETPIIILSEDSTEKIRLAALQNGAQDYLIQNEFNNDLLTKSILFAIQRKENTVKMYENYAKKSQELLKSNESLKNKIEKNKKSDKKLRANEKREQARSEEFARVLDAVPAAVWISHDNKGLLITGNQLSYD